MCKTQHKSGYRVGIKKNIKQNGYNTTRQIHGNNTTYCLATGLEPRLETSSGQLTCHLQSQAKFSELMLLFLST